MKSEWIVTFQDPVFKKQKKFLEYADSPRQAIDKAITSLYFLLKSEKQNLCDPEIQIHFVPISVRSTMTWGCDYEQQKNPKTN